MSEHTESLGPWPRKIEVWVPDGESDSFELPDCPAIVSNTRCRLSIDGRTITVEPGAMEEVEVIPAGDAKETIENLCDELKDQARISLDAFEQLARVEAERDEWRGGAHREYKRVDELKGFKKRLLGSDGIDAVANHMAKEAGWESLAEADMCQSDDETSLGDEFRHEAYLALLAATEAAEQESPHDS